MTAVKHTDRSTDRPLSSDDAEEAVLGAMLSDERAILRARATLRPEHFYREKHQRLFAAMLEVHADGRSVDPVTLSAHLAERALLEACGGKEYVSVLVDAVPTSANVEYHAEIVREKAGVRAMLDVLAQSTTALTSGGTTSREAAQAVLNALIPHAVTTTGGGYRRVREFLWPVLEAIEARVRPGAGGGLRTGYSGIDNHTAGFRPGELVIFAGAEKSGKAQPLDARVRTPTGWTTIGALRVGDAVASVDGAPSRVTGVFPQGERDVWRVTFSDGATARCCAEHLWQVERSCEGRPVRVLTTRELADFVRRNPKRVVIPTVSGEGMGNTPSDGRLPLHPYAVGALIGDGSLRDDSVCWSKSDVVVVERMRSALPATCRLQPADDRGYWRVVGTEHGTNAALAALRGLGLAGCRSAEKHIPRCYLDAGTQDRRELLRGLLDTDGSTEGNGQVSYTTVSPQLASDVRELVESLGGLVTTRLRPAPAYTHRGESRTGQPAYRLTLRGGPWLLDLLTLERHRRALPRLTRRTPHRVVVSAAPDGTRAPMACIAVSHASQLYVTDHYIVTHNTSVALNVAQRVLEQHTDAAPIGVGIVSAEMTAESIVERLLARQARVEIGRLASGRLVDDDFPRLARVAGQLSSDLLWIDDEAEPALSDIVARATYLKAAHPEVQLIVVDFLQLVTARERGLAEHQELKRIAYGLKALAKRLGVVVIAPCQVNSKEVEELKVPKPRLKDLQGSSGMRQAADFIALVYRPGLYDELAHDAETIELDFAACRRTPRFTARLRWNGGTMTVSE